MSVGAPGDGDAEALGEIEFDGEIDALGEIDTELDGEIEALGLRLEDGDTDGDEEAEGDRLELGDIEELADGDSELEGDREGDALELALSEGLTDADGEIEVDAEGLTEAEADRDALAEGEIDAASALPGFVVSFKIRPSNFVVITVSGNVPSDASATHVKTKCRIEPTSVAAWVIVPAMTGYGRSDVYEIRKSMCVAVAASEPVLPAVSAVLTSFCVNEAPSARRVAPDAPARSAALWVSEACANATNLRVEADSVPMTSTVVTVATAPPTAIAMQSTRRWARPGVAGTSE